MENIKKSFEKLCFWKIMFYHTYTSFFLRKTLDSKSVKEYTLTKESKMKLNVFVKILQIFTSLYILSQMRIVEITFQDFSYLRESLAS